MVCRIFARCLLGFESLPSLRKTIPATSVCKKVIKKCLLNFITSMYWIDFSPGSWYKLIIRLTMVLFEIVLSCRLLLKCWMLGINGTPLIYQKKSNPKHVRVEKVHVWSLMGMYADLQNGLEQTCSTCRNCELRYLHFNRNFNYASRELRILITFVNTRWPDLFIDTLTVDTACALKCCSMAR